MSATDTIDVAALVERYISRARELSDNGKLPWWKDLADLLQSQADALAEARRKLAKAYEQTEAVQCEAMTATASLATMREVLERVDAMLVGLMVRHDPDGAEQTMSGDEANKRVQSFARDAAAVVSHASLITRRALGGSNAK